MARCFSLKGNGMTRPYRPCLAFFPTRPHRPCLAFFPTRPHRPCLAFFPTRPYRSCLVFFPTQLYRPCLVFFPTRSYRSCLAFFPTQPPPHKRSSTLPLEKPPAASRLGKSADVYFPGGGAEFLY